MGVCVGLCVWGVEEGKQRGIAGKGFMIGYEVKR